MKLPIFKLQMPVAACCVMMGCVTANNLDVPVEIKHFGKDKHLDECLLLCVDIKGIKKDGYWWVAQKEKRSAGIPVRASVKIIDSGDHIFQEGHNVWLIGPYVRGRMTSYEYWAFKKGYQPENFMDLKLDRARKLEKPASVSLEETNYTDDYSNEHVLDGARAVTELANAGLLLTKNETTRKLIKLTISQAEKVQKNSLELRRRKEAESLLKILKKIIPAKSPGPVPIEE